MPGGDCNQHDEEISMFFVPTNQFSEDYWKISLATVMRLCHRSRKQTTACYIHQLTTLWGALLRPWRNELDRLIKVERDKLMGGQKDDKENRDAGVKRMAAELAKEKDDKQKEDGEASGRGTLIVKDRERSGRGRVSESSYLLPIFASDSTQMNW
jgi:hypothetical protein